MPRRLTVLSAFLLLAAVAAPTASPAPQDELTIVLVRHAETELPPYADNPPNPFLNEIGLARAAALAERLAPEGLDHVFSTEYRRTWHTALPVAHAAGLEVEAYDPRDLAGAAEQLRGMRGRILVVGHSNTTPMLVEALGGDPGTPIDDATEFDRIYTMTIRDGSVVTDQRRYGEPLPERMLADDRTQRDAAWLASSQAFDFYNSFWFNVHDALYWHALPRRGAPDANSCLSSLSAEHRGGWDGALAYYVEQMAERNARMDPLMRELRFHFTALSDEPLSAEAQAVIEQLRAAAPAYQLCMWADHDARNRAWLHDLLALLQEHETVMLEHLDALYQTEYPRRLPVDLVSYGNWAGANTTGRPLHMQFGVAHDDLAAPVSLEILFHEGSHGVFGPGWGHTTEVLEAAFEPRGLDVGRDYWHAVLFFTTGHVATEILRAAGYPDYVPYMVQGDVYGEYYPLLEETWKPYLEGDYDLETAAERLAEAVVASR